MTAMKTPLPQRMARAQADDLIARGYRRTSNRHRMVSRVDRPAWKQAMAAYHSPWDPAGEGMAWVRLLGDRAADHYRRCHSKDKKTVPGEVFKLIPGSIGDPVGYVGEGGDDL